MDKEVVSNSSRSSIDSSANGSANEKNLLGIPLSLDFDPMSWEFVDDKPNETVDSCSISENNQLTNTNIVLNQTSSFDHVKSNVYSNGHLTSSMLMDSNEYDSSVVHVTNESDSFRWPTNNHLLKLSKHETSDMSATTESDSSSHLKINQNHLNVIVNGHTDVYSTNMNDTNMEVPISIESANKIADKIVGKCIDSLHDELSLHLFEIHNNNSASSQTVNNSSHSSVS